MKTAPFLVAAAFTVCAAGLAPAAVAISPECANLQAKIDQLRASGDTSPQLQTTYNQLCPTSDTPCFSDSCAPKDDPCANINGLLHPVDKYNCENPPPTAPPTLPNGQPMPQWNR